jgi:hypothetical protein
MKIFSVIFINEREFWNNATHIHLTAIIIVYHDGNCGCNSSLSRAFRWKSLHGWDFRPQLIVVSGLFGGNPFVDGILGHNLLLPRAFLVGIPSWMGF